MSLPICKSYVHKKRVSTFAKTLLSFCGIKVYPNPANDLVTLEYQLSDAKAMPSVIIINQIGQEVYRGSFTGGQGSKSIAVKSWAPGLYLYKINSENFDALGTFIINH